MAKTRTKYKNPEVKKAYQKERRRVQAFINRAGKRGYVFEKNPLPKIPKTVTEASIRALKKLTPDVLYKKSLYIKDTETGDLISGEKGRKIERKRAAKKAQITKQVQAELNQIKAETEAQIEKTQYTQEKSTLPEAPKMVDVVLDNLTEEIEKWTPKGEWTAKFQGIKETDKNILKNILQGAINAQGREAVALRIEENADRLKTLFQEILYGSGSKEYHLQSGRKQVQLDLQEVAQIIQGRSMTAEEAIRFMDAMEQEDYEE